MTPPTPTEIKAFLDDLAALSAAHGLYIDLDVIGTPTMAIDRLTGAPGSRIGGYVAGFGRGYWTVGVYETDASPPHGSTTDRLYGEEMGRRDRLSGHQRLELAAALARVREILGGDGG